jgi:hypothetical protein
MFVMWRRFCYYDGIKRFGCSGRDVAVGGWNKEEPFVLIRRDAEKLIQRRFCV